MHGACELFFNACFSLFRFFLLLLLYWLLISDGQTRQAKKEWTNKKIRVYKR